MFQLAGGRGSAGLLMEGAGLRCGVMVHGGLCEVGLQLAVQVRGESAAWQVAANLVDGGPGGQEWGGPADGRWRAALWVFLSGERAPDVRDHGPELGGLDGLRAG